MIRSLVSSRGPDGKGFVDTHTSPGPGLRTGSPLWRPLGLALSLRLQYWSPDPGQPRCFVWARPRSPGRGGPSSVSFGNVFTDAAAPEKQFSRFPRGASFPSSVEDWPLPGPCTPSPDPAPFPCHSVPRIKRRSPRARAHDSVLCGSVPGTWS